MDRQVNIGVIGLGARGLGLLKVLFGLMQEKGIVKVTAVCDYYSDRAEAGAAFIEEKFGYRPLCTTDWHEVINCDDVEAVMVLTAWESHVDICTAAMYAGKKVGVEVGGAYSIEDCYRLVRAYEETGIHCMMLENCCYGRRELMALNMARLGVFGTVVHCEGGYLHDLREEIVNGDINRHYRQRNYMNRNCENYPTHELGPIMQVLDINRGNRFVSLCSVASCSKGLAEYAAEHRGADHELAKFNYAQGDVVTTIIKCAHGQTVVIKLDTTLPRIYSRGFTVRGTKGMYAEDGDYVHLDGESEFSPLKDKIGNAESYAEKYEHPLWKEYRNNPIGGHDGIDWLVYNAFIESVRDNTVPPIDTYDTAVLMAISPLSEQSVAMGGAPVAIPDFTCGRWIEGLEKGFPESGKYSLKK